MSPNGGVRLYAEFLLNISQVTIFAALDLTGHDADATAQFFSDRKRIKITYAGETAAITYPNGISGTAVVHLPIKAAAQLSLRLEITEKGDPYWKHSLETLNDSPWTAHSFSAETVLACASCRAVVCDAGRIRTWKDLPRGDWAETMDLWHCHKPTDVPGAEARGEGKAFDKAVAPVPSPGVAFIDSGDIIITKTDADFAKDKNHAANGELRCKQCDKVIGRSSGNADESIKLHKWNLSVKRTASAEWETNDIQSLLCVQLLELADSQASKKFLLEPLGDEKSAEPLLIWVLNPDLKYCASYVEDGQPRRAMKVLYKDVARGASDSSQPQADSSLHLPEDVLATIRHDLGRSNSMMPPAARTVQGWTAGLLDRFNPVKYDP